MGDSNLNFPLQTVPLLMYPGAPVHPGSSAETLYLNLKGSPRGKEGRSPQSSFPPRLGTLENQDEACFQTGYSLTQIPHEKGTLPL